MFDRKKLKGVVSGRSIDLDAERNFENAKLAGSGARRRQSRFYWAVDLAVQAHEETVIDAIFDKRVIEIGCSNGSKAVIYSECAETYLGLDISDVAISACWQRNLNNAKFLCVDGHRLPVEDESFDCIIVNSLLHHMSLAEVLGEVNRCLTPDGILIFREPLGINPAYQLYRWFTPQARTADEKPFDRHDINMLQRYFCIEQVKWIGFSSLLAAFIQSNRLRVALTRVDEWLAGFGIGRLYWQIAGTARKRVLNIT